MSSSPISDSKPYLPTFMAGILAFLLFGVLAMWMLKSGDFETTDQKRAGERRQNLQTLRKAEEEKLTTYGWNDKTKGLAHIPVDRAMELELDALKQKPVQPSSTPVNAPAAPAAAPASASAVAPIPTPAKTSKGN